jgi:thioredoxin 2
MNNEDVVMLTCPQCGAQNRVPANRLNEHPRCGRCHTPLPVGTYVNRPKDITDSDFQREVLTSVVPVLVEFTSPRCPYCRLLAPTIDQLAAAFGGRIKFVRMNVEVNPRMASLFTVQGTPTLLFFKEGKAVDRIVGVLSREEIERRLMQIVEKS